MILQELIDTLPNGFHDSKVAKMEIDYVARTLTFRLHVWVGSLDAPEGPERERLRPAVLELRGLEFCAIEQPDARYEYAKAAPLWIDVSELPVSQPVPDAAFGFRVFVQQWNAFMNIAARDAVLVWQD